MRAHDIGNSTSAKPPFDNSVETQRKRLLSYLEKKHGLSTIEAREKLGILHPGGRIMELRKKGYRIDTYWIEESDSNGVAQRIGLYVYQGKSGGAMKYHADLNDLYKVLQITADGFIEAVIMLPELPPQKIEEGIASCDKWLEMLKKDFEQFKTDVLGGDYAQK